MPDELTLKVEYVPINKVLRYAQNTRDHSDAQIDQIAASIRANGFVNPCLVDANGVLIAGHGRVAGAERAGLKKVPIIRLGHLSDTQARALRIADNAIALNASWNQDLLRIELTELKLEGYDLNLTGFDDVQLVQFMVGVPTGADPEATPEPPTTPVSRRADLWLLGTHRLLCGDATNAEDVERLLDGAKPHLMVTDQPWGVEYDADWRNHRFRTNGTAVGGRAIGKVENDHISDWSAAWDLFVGDVAYVWSASLCSDEVIAGLEGAGLMRRSLVVWSKNNITVGRGDYQWQHEVCWYAVRKGRTGHWNGDRSQSTVWQIDKPHKSETGHSTQKPIECMKRPIENNSRPGDGVYEPFAGSFTTGIACEMTQRKCYAMEISEQYMDLGILRWQDFSSKEARHADTGLTYEQTKADRAKAPSKRKRAPRAIAAE